MRKIIATVCIALAGLMSAQANAYTLENTDDGNGFILSLPDGFTLTGTDFGEFGGNGGAYYTFYTQSFTTDTLVAFNWNFASTDYTQPFTGSVDTAGYTLWTSGGNQSGTTSLTTDFTFEMTESGSASVQVAAGQTFGWYVWSINGLYGAGNLTVSNLIETPTAAVPEPTGLALMLAGLGTVGLYRRARRQAK